VGTRRRRRGSRGVDVSVILAHPRQKSFNHALAAAVVDALRQDGHAVRFHDLYLEAFNPVIDEQELRQRRSDDRLVEDHCLEAADADVFIIVHPNWWGQPPAILKGYPRADHPVNPALQYCRGLPPPVWMNDNNTVSLSDFLTIAIDGLRQYGFLRNLLANE
jgi:hypothetical protein